MTMTLRVVGGYTPKQIQLHIQKNTPRFIGESIFHISKRVRDISIERFNRLHTKYSTGKSVNSIRVRKYSNYKSVVIGNQTVMYQELGVQGHKIDNAFGMGITVLHPGHRDVPVLRPASKEVLAEVDGITKQSFNNWLKL